MLKTRELLARNLRLLMKKHGHTIQSLNELAPELSTGTIQRIGAGKTNTELRHFDTVAAAYGLEPWQLLAEDFDPDLPPRLSRHFPKSDHAATLMDGVKDPEHYALIFALVTYMTRTGKVPPGMDFAAMIEQSTQPATTSVAHAPSASHPLDR